MSITSASQGTSAAQTIAPYSIETVVLTPGAGHTASVGTPTSPSATQVGATSATINWSTPSSGTAVRYEVYRQVGTTSELLAESTSNSATLQNLVPGTAYTINVLATDQSGKLSVPSDPVTFTTSTPTSSTCAVDYQVTDGWGNGFNAAVTITDTGPSPIDGWSLTFAFPSAGETVSGGWNANWSNSGQNVEATSLDWNAQLAANGGNSQSIGFTGANTGAYQSPAAISLNGTVCTTTYSS
jgi:cellulase/cellobiase CelA1